MTSFKKNIFIIIFLSLLTGCMNSEKPDANPAKDGDIFTQEEKNSTFFLDPKSPKNIRPVGGEFNKFNVATGKSYDFKVCILSQAKRRELPNFPFDITTHDESKFVEVNLETDDKGCLNWTEVISYDPVKQVVNPNLFIRKIHGKGTVQGMRRFIFELFPWSKERGDFDEFRDLTRSELELRKSLDCIIAMETGKPSECNRFSSLTMGEDDQRAKLSVARVDYDLYKSGNFNIIPRGSERALDGSFVDNAFRTDAVTRLEPDQIKKVLSTPQERSDYVTRDKKSEYAGVLMDLRLRIKVQREFQGVDGKRFKALNDGEFKVQPFVYWTDLNGGSPVLLTPKMPPMTQTIQNGELNVYVKSIVQYIPTSGRAVLALRLTPIDEHGQFAVVEDLFDIGPFDSLVGSKGGLMRNFRAINANVKWSFQDFVQSARGPEIAIENGDLRKSAPYEFSMFNIKFRTVEAGETSTKRTVIYTTTTCVTDERARRVAQGAEFEVYSLRYPIDYVDDGDDTNDVEGVDYKVFPLFTKKEGDKIKADPGGCIRFIDKMTHKYYKTERLVKRKVFIKRKGDDTDPGKELTVYINPWDEKFGTFGTDARAVSQTFIEDLQRRKKIPTRFFIKDFGYETLRFRYEIDKNMKLQVKKTVLFRMRPLVLRYSNILQGINSIHDVRDGIYLLKLAYQKDYLDPAASVRDVKAKMLQTGLPEKAIAPVLRIQSQVQSHPFDKKKGDMTITTNRHVPQMELVEEPKGGLNPDDIHAGKVLTNDIRVRTQRARLGNAPQVVSNIDPRKKQNLSLVKKLVRVNAGNIITPIEFSVDDLRLLRIRSQLFVQLEPINQVRLQLVNMAGKLIEDSLVMKKGRGSKYTCLPEHMRKDIQKEKMEALDILAKSIDDNVYISSVEDLKKIFEQDVVVQAFKKFSSFGEYENLNTIFNMIQHKGMTFEEQQRLLDESHADNVEQKRIGDIASKVDADNELIRLEQELSEAIKNEGSKQILPGQRLGGDQITPGWRIAEDDVSQEYSHHNPQFAALCRGTDNYQDCLTEAKNKSYDPKVCKCFDNTSSDYAPIETELAKILDQDMRDKDSVAKFLSTLTGEDALSDLLTNDFTVNAASSDVSDLDLLLDEYLPDDIQPRTFVGPLTFVKNSNSGALRPTDNLDEAHCVTDDCNTVDPIDRYGNIKNFSYERSKYHGSIAHFADAQVDTFIKGGTLQKSGEVIPSYQEYKAQKAKNEDFAALLYHFVKGMNLNYVSLTDKPLLEPTCFDINKKTGNCLKENKSHYFKKNKLIDDYVKSLVYFQLLPNEPGAIKAMKQDEENEYNYQQWGKLYSYEAPTVSNLKALVKMPYPSSTADKDIGVVPVGYAKFNERQYANICGYLVYGVMGPSIQKSIKTMIEKDKDNPMQPEVREMLFKNDAGQRLRTLFQTCKKQAPYSIAIERKYKINQTGRYYYLGGKSLNINLGQSVGISHSSSVSRNFSVSPSDIIQGIVGGKGRGKSIFGSWGWSYGKGAGYSASAGTSINQGTFLVMQNAEFDVELTNYEQCLTARWSEPSIKGFSDIFLGGFLNPQGEGDYKSALSNSLRSGLMICSGEEETQPLAVRETYYYFTQHFVEGDMQDRNDIHNHPWLLSLRGLREYETFLASTHSDHIQAEKDDVETVDAFELVGAWDMVKSDLESVKQKKYSDGQYDKFQRLRRHSWPLKQLIRTYRRISPTFPGLYTQLDRDAYASEQWPWESEPGNSLNEEARKEEFNCPKLQKIE